MGMFQQAASQMRVPSFGQSYKNALEVKNMQQRNALAQQQAERQARLDQRNQMQYEAEAYTTALKTGNSEHGRQVLDMYLGEGHGIELDFDPKQETVKFKADWGSGEVGRKDLADFYQWIDENPEAAEDPKGMSGQLEQLLLKPGTKSLNFGGQEQVKYDNLTDGKTTRAVKVGSDDYSNKISGGWYKGVAPKSTTREDKGPSRSDIKDVKAMSEDLAGELGEDIKTAMPRMDAFHKLSNDPFFYVFKDRIKKLGPFNDIPAKATKIDLPVMQDGTQITLEDIRETMVDTKSNFKTVVENIFKLNGMESPWGDK